MNLEQIFEAKNLSVTISSDDLREFFDYVTAKKPEKKTEAEKYITVNEVCQVAGVSRPTLHRWRTRGLITAIKLGKSVRFRLSDIERLMKEGI